MAHIRTQIRDAFKAYLRGKLGYANVYSASQSLRGFQKDNLPLVLIAVTESISVPQQSGNDYGYRTVERDVTVLLKIFESTAFEDFEERHDAKCAEIERLLCDPNPIGLGQLSNWTVGGSSPPDIDEIGENLAAWHVTMPVTFTIRTLDGNPEQNLFT